MSTANKIQSFQLFSTQGSSAAQEDFVLGRQERGLFVVADGFGGASAGYQAAKAACEAVLSFLQKEAGDLEATLPFVLRSYYSLAGNVLFNSLIHANERVNSLNQKKTSANEKGGASVVAGFFDEGLFALANVGCCSAWMIREQRLQELVTPRSYARLRDPFVVDPGPDDAIPLMAMGTAIDLEPEIVEFQVRPGDLVLLQTDGVRDATRELLLENISSSPEELEALLRETDYVDNASFALVRFG